MSSAPFSKPNVAAQNQLVTWLNEAGMSDGIKKADLLRRIVEVLLHQVTQMIPVYLENILSYVSDKSADVRKIMIGLIEEISKNHSEHLPKVISQLRTFLNDSVVAVQKRAIQACSIVYKSALIWICESEAEEKVLFFVWQQLSELKLQILNMIDSDNEGIRTHSIKFLEEVVLLQTAAESTDSNEDFSLEKLPRHFSFIRKKSLEEEAEHIFSLLLKFHNSQHISSVNLMACMTTLCLLAKLRLKYMPRVIQALGDLHTTLPPTLSQSQVNSVRKHLKMLLLNLVKHPSSNEMIPQIGQLLIDIGMTPSEINKAIPKERRNKRLWDVKSGDGPSKRIRLDSPQTSQSSDSNSRSDFNFTEEVSETTKPVVTEESLYEGLNSIDNVVAVIMNTLLNHLPENMPSNFTSLYKPIPNAGTKTQKKTLAKMMHALIKGEPIVAPQPVKAPVQPSLSDIAAKIPLLREDEEKQNLKNAVAKLQESTKQMENSMTKRMEEERQDHLRDEENNASEKDKEKLIPPPTPTVPKLKQRVKLLKLQEITRPIPKEIKEKLVIQSVARILNAEKDAEIGGVANIRSKLITIFASSYTPELRELVLSYILDDPAKRLDLGLMWLYEEYAFMQGFNRHPVTLYPKMHEKHDQNYNQLLCALLTQICERADPAVESSRELLLRKLFLEAPLITEEAVDYLKQLVTDRRTMYIALELLEEICIFRPPRAHKYVTALLNHVLNENEETRSLALSAVLKVYRMSSDSVKKVIEKYGKLYLGFIALNSPPMDLFLNESVRIKHMWTDEMYKTCLNLIMALFQENYASEILIDIARVYGQASADAKRCVLRVVETPLRSMSGVEVGAGAGVETPECFLRLLEECPKGAETLLTRLVHIITEKAPPTPQLVSRVRAVYASRVADVRFLIPVLNGLTSKEVLAALPKLIKLNPVVVKEVFNKLLGLQNPNEENLPVTPAELLVALHLIDPSVAELKYIIKATALCFAEKQVYTQEVLCLVLERLLEEREIPVLLMRSVLQALTLYPNMAPFVLNVLHTLIDKEIWKHKVAWEGWLKCVERTAPASQSLVAALPPAVLATLPPSVLATLPPSVLATLPANCQPQIPPAGYSMEQYPQPVPAPTMPHEPLPPGME